jgi:endonuclease YncB( thermonuclease family)
MIRRTDPTTVALVIVASLLAIAVVCIAIERGVGPFSFAQPKPTTLPKILTGAPLTSAASSAEAISPHEITVIDGDTIRARGRIVRLVGFDAPESGPLSRCDRERATADRAAAHMRSVVAGGGLELRRVPCSCRPGTEGSSLCNYGRACGELRSHGRDVAGIMIGLSLARSYVCGATTCPPRESWC